MQELADIIGRYVRDSGGTPQASVVGWGYKTNSRRRPSPTGSSATVWTTRFKGSRPPTALRPALPAALALGEQHQASGKTLITAYALGWEIQGRLRAASAPATAPAYHPPGLVGPLGGAAGGSQGPLGWTANRP